MSFLGIGGGGNIFSSITNIAFQAALGVATGGTSLLVTTALKSVMLAIGDQVLQQVGQQLGLPQAVIDMAQATFHSAAGDVDGARQNVAEATTGLANLVGGNAFDAGQLNRTAQDSVADLVESVLQKARDGDSGADESGNAKGVGAAKGKPGDSFLMRLAFALGSAVDSKMEEMLDKAEKLDQRKTEEAQATKDGDVPESKTGVMSAEIQALGQEISMLSQALANGIKSVGEAGTTLARKG